MPSYRGKFEYHEQNGTLTQQGPCQVQFDDEAFTLVPEAGAALVFDLGDVDALKPADYEIALLLYTGCTLRLQQFGKSYENLASELLESYRKRTLQCLLLADLQEVDRFTGAFTLETSGQVVSGPAEIRLFKSNLAVLPTEAQAFQWRLADLDDLRFDAQNYEIVLESQSGRLSINRLAKRTEVFHSRLKETVEALKAESTQAMHAILPFLNPDELQAAATILREAHAAAESRLAAVNPRIPAAFIANALDKALKPYIDDLLGRAAKESVFAGFKLVRPQDRDLMEAIGEGASDDAGVTSDDVTADVMPDADPNVPPVLYWFFFPIAAEPGGREPGNVVAWEASSSSGGATYFFRLTDAAEAGVSRDGGKPTEALERAVERINRVLAMLNFRRRPIYLSDDALSGNPVFHRYAIAARRISDLRSVRAAFLGRATHSSLETWQAQVKSILASAGYPQR